jgi:hypothetical protein
VAKTNKMQPGLGVVVMGCMLLGTSDSGGFAQTSGRTKIKEHGALRAGPSGIIYLLEPDSVEHPAEKSKRPLGQRSFWTNPDIDGALVRSHWDKIEPTEGKFDWGYLDEAVQLASAHHKQLGLSVTAGVFTPTWLYAKGAQPLRFLEPFGGKLRPAVMPLPWDPVFLKYWGRFIEALGRRYAARPEVAYVVMGGLGRWIEAYFIEAPQDLAQLRALGGVSRWVEGSKRIMDLYAHAFPRTPFILVMAPPIPGPEGQEASRQIVEDGTSKYPGHLGLCSAGLREKMGTSPRMGYTPTAIRAFSDKTTVGFQMLLPSDPVKRPLRPSLENGVRLGGHYIEVYPKDCDNPAYADLLRETSRALKGQR